MEEEPATAPVTDLLSKLSSEPPDLIRVLDRRQDALVRHGGDHDRATENLIRAIQMVFHLGLMANMASNRIGRKQT
jgi:hypothetical protein